MKGFLAGLLASLSLTLGNLLGGHKNSIPVPQIAIDMQSASASGQVMGAQTSGSSSLGDKLSGIGNVVGKLAGAMGSETVKTGQTLINNVTTTPSSKTDVIDMASVVHDISSRVESIPGNLVNQAKVEYCKQVLLAATASGTKK